MGAKTLKSELAGTWYADDAEMLGREIDSYLETAQNKSFDDLIALILPHAGYRYSGMVAAQGIKQLEGRSIKRVIALGPSHRVAMLDTVSIPDVSHIETPFGKLGLDRELIERLWENERFQSHLRAHSTEHSVQIELPLLQRVLGDFKLVPIVCGELDAPSAIEIADLLLPELDEETLLVISTDFTHYGRTFDYVPFTDNIQKNLETLDMGAFRLIENGSLPDFLHYIQNTGATICGRSPIAVLLALMGPDARVELLKYDTSGNMTGDWSHCVSYVSAAVAGHWRSVDAAADEQPAGPALSSADKMMLLALARHKMTQQLRKNEPELSLEISPAMREVMGAFVTIYKYGKLRGCIGEIFPRRELFAAVAEQAVNAAFHDPRFPHLREDELADINIEVSALTPPRKVDSVEDIEIGRHGIVLYKGIHSSVFLPQVAPEQGWDLETTLANLAMKAGLGPNDWTRDCEFEVFEALVFGEKG